MDAYGWLQRLVHLGMPWRCLLCGMAGVEGIDLCEGCIADMPRNNVCCTRCALPLAVPAELCGRCQRRPPPWETAWVPFVYAWPLDALATRLKFSGDLACGRALAALWTEALPAVRPDLIVPVPLHRRRLRERGYNQAWELARPLARACGIPVRSDILRRTRESAPQTELDASARRNNVRKAFSVRPAFAWPTHVAIVDDVMTTGATLAECALTLRRAGVRRIDVWALARAPTVPHQGAMRHK